MHGAKEEDVLKECLVGDIFFTKQTHVVNLQSKTLSPSRLIMIGHDVIFNEALEEM